jgi:hypothetical protein
MNKTELNRNGRVRRTLSASSDLPPANIDSNQGAYSFIGLRRSNEWELFPVIGIDVAKHAALMAGYRVLGMDYETGSGDQFFKYDVITQGIVLGVSFHF